MGSAVHPQRVRYARSEKLGFPGEAFHNFFGAWMSLAAPVFSIKLKQIKSCHNLKSSMTSTSHSGMIIVARFHSLPRLIGVTFKKQLYTHEIEHEENLTRRDDYNACEDFI